MRTLRISLFYPLAVIALVASFLPFTGFNSNVEDSNMPTTHIVIIKGMTFEPENIKVLKGDIVEWINKDIVPHDVTETDRKWTSGPLNTGQKWSKKITESTGYFCSIHVVMKGTVMVAN